MKDAMQVSLHAAYFGFNFGDTLLCRLFCGWLREAGATHINLPLANETNRRLIGADSIGLHEFARAKAVLFSGGGYFSESYRQPLVWTMRHVMRFDTMLQSARAMRKPYAIMGVGAGPLSLGVARAATRSAFRGACDIVVRDKESRDFLRDIGMRRELTVTPDAVALCSAETLLGRPREPARPGCRIFLHLAPNPSVQEIAVAMAVIDFVAPLPDVSITIGNDYCHDGQSIPSRHAEELLYRARGAAARVHFFEYDAEPDTLLSMLDDCDLVVTPKLHVGIAATVLEKFVIAVPTHSKTPRYYAQIGQSDHCLALHGECEPPLRALLARWQAGETPDWSRRRAMQDESFYRDRIRRFLADI